MLLAYNPTQPLSLEDTEGGRLHFYERGENIPLVTEGVWQVYRGVAQLSQLSPQGEEILLGWAQPGTFFGSWLTCVDSYQVKGLSDLYLKWYPIADLSNSPELSQMAFTQLARRMRQTEALLAISGLKRVEDRLQQLLCLLKQELGETTDEGIRIRVRLTHQNLAGAIGTTRVTVTRLIGEFQRQGWLSFDGDRHMILDPL
ncbi:transcriptional regulatory protein [Crocosphaera subtropica ATCC 51142]|uniref:Transcriptional regulatory protein n=1 Tax=Crocosphaera subtropica (strain ATCC 51142 / BH68) TaxID=43989 RepID=B1WZL4_CROS5|nr:Crp/Fnr family transcriptional regulator [Crocosphaera subtropica]ACB51166.1 transcriptional regulatory protein [Crocosphaera subtropica ATCC 51142]